MLRVKILMPLFLLLAVSACSPKVPIKNIALYWDAGDGTATESWTDSDTTSVLDKAQWDALRPTTVAMTYEDFAWIRSTIEKLCSEMKVLCTKDTQKKMATYFGHIDKIAARRGRR